MDTDQFVSIAGLIAEPVRATMLWHLLDGRAYTAGELAIAADVSPQSASNHLSKLVQKGLLSIEKQGRHRYYKLARPEVAYVIESIANLLPQSISTPSSPYIKPTGVRYARTCYDHLAGKVGVLVTKSLIEQGLLTNEEKHYSLTMKGMDWFEALGIDIENLKRCKRSFAHRCLDWSEREHHLAGALGASLLNTMLDRDWMRRKKNSREIIITHAGREHIQKLLNLDLY